MGKTAKWLRSLLGSKKSSPPPASSSASVSPLSREKRSKWALSKSKNEHPLASPYADGLDSNKHAIAVAAATAAVAEAALAAAQAAAEVVRLTSSAGSGRSVPAYVSCDRRRVAAAIKIQSAFRAYLARRALRALKGLVKLQALVRGHIVRKQSADMLRRMQAMARIQARASAHRFKVSDSSKANVKFSNHHQSLRVVNHPRSQWPDNGKHSGYTTKESRMSNRGSKESSHMASNWLNQWMEQHSWNNRHDTSCGDDERSTKILEIDTGKPRQSTRRSDRAFPARNETGQKLDPSMSSEEVSSVISAKEVDPAAIWTAESSPRVHSALSRPPVSNVRGMFTPTRSECSRSLYGDYLSHPSYMANTESSRAKVRSQSAPRQRMPMDKLGVSSTFGQNAWESDAISEKGYVLPPNYRSHTYLKRQPGAPHGVIGYRF